LKERCTKQKNGKIRKTRPFGRGNLYHLLSNPVYIGKTRHQDNIYDGEHQPIIDQELWDAVQARRASNTQQRQSSTNQVSTSILTGLVFDETGDRLTPTHANKKGIRYRYYCSNRLINGDTNDHDGWRLPAKEIEQPILNILNQHLANPLKLSQLIDLERCSIDKQQRLLTAATTLAETLTKSPASKHKQILASFIHRIELAPSQINIDVDASRLESLLTTDGVVEVDGEPGSNFPAECSNANIKRFEITHQLKKRGVEAKLVLADGNIQAPTPDQNLIKLIAKAHLWFARLSDGTAISISDLANQQNEDPTEISRFLPLAFLAPVIVESILAGTQPVDLTIEKLRRIPALPISWTEQREMLDFVG
jgi:site-specific DNA recombinase